MAEIELAQHTANMGFDRFIGDDQALGNFVVGQAIGNALQYLELTIGQQVAVADDLRRLANRRQ